MHMQGVHRRCAIHIVGTVLVCTNKFLQNGCWVLGDSTHPIPSGTAEQCPLIPCPWTLPTAPFPRTRRYLVPWMLFMSRGWVLGVQGGSRCAALGAMGPEMLSPLKTLLHSL